MTDGFTAIRSWAGRWQWNPRTAVFTNPVHSRAWEAQIQDIEASEDRLIIRNDLTLQGGVRRRWTFDGALDGKPRSITWDDDGSVMTVIAFFQLGPMMGATPTSLPTAALLVPNITSWPATI